MPKRYRLEITSHAERDVSATYDFIFRDKPAAASRWVRTLESQMRKLERFPLRHALIPEAAELGVEYRQMLFGNYRLIYRIEDDRVIILRVIHAARLLDQSFFH